MRIEAKVALAVSVGDFKAYGCPFCGSPKGYARVTSNGAATIWECGGCHNPYVILAEGVAQSPLFVNVDGARVRPVLRPHPRAIAHRPDLANLTETVAPDQSGRAE